MDRRSADTTMSTAQEAANALRQFCSYIDVSGVDGRNVFRAVEYVEERHLRRGWKLVDYLATRGFDTRELRRHLHRFEQDDLDTALDDEEARLDLEEIELTIKYGNLDSQSTNRPVEGVTAAISPSIAPRKPRGKRGRPISTSPQQDANVYDNWLAGKASGKYKTRKDYAHDLGYTSKKFNLIYDRERKRRMRNKSPNKSFDNTCPIA